MNDMVGLSAKQSQPEEPASTPQSYIVVHFKDVGSAILGTQFVGITPGQLILAGEILMMKGKQAMIDAERAAEEESKIAKPTDGGIAVARGRFA